VGKAHTDHHLSSKDINRKGKERGWKGLLKHGDSGKGNKKSAFNGTRAGGIKNRK